MTPPLPLYAYFIKQYPSLVSIAVRKVLQQPRILCILHIAQWLEICYNIPRGD